MEYGTSWTTIANLALQKLGRPAISDLNTDKGYGTPAPIIKGQLPITLNAVLGSRPWRCMTVKASIPRLTDTPPDYKYRYQIPGDYIRLVDVITENGEEYQLSGNFIDTDSGSVILRYVGEPSDAMAMPTYLQMAVAFHLAMFIAPLLNADSQLQTALASEYTLAVANAWSLDNADIKDKIFMSGIADELAAARRV